MKKYILIILLIPFLISWKWQTHELLVENVYYNTDLNNQLDLEYLKLGSIAPDKDFKDYRNHHYPKSYNLTLLWLERSKLFYENGDIKNSSYSFGVASHYISDSFVSPHYISKEDPKLHAKFESQIKYLKTNCKKRSFDLKKELEKASENEKLWHLWLETKDQSIVQDEAEQSLDLIYQVALSTFNADCKNKKTEFKKVYFIINRKIILYSTAIIAFLVIISRELFND